jgi:dTDP-4-amino-4,6-dideoxygalactose transaminase
LVDGHFNAVRKIGRESKRRLAFVLDQENIESSPLWKPMHLQPIFESYPYYGNQVAERLFGDGLCLPSGFSITVVDKERITIALNRFF